MTKELVEKYLGCSVRDDEFVFAARYAKRKLELAIEREGDAGGMRREPWYLAQLTAETIQAERFSAYCYEMGTQKEREHPTAC